MLEVRMALAPGALAVIPAHAFNVIIPAHDINPVIPANAGIQASYSARTPAYAGVTSRGAC
jgi:hypothetical protein